jgi:hypothetical protein
MTFDLERARIIAQESYPVILENYPKIEDLLDQEPGISVPVAQASTFDDLISLRSRLQRFEVSLRREADTQADYERFSESVKFWRARGIDYLAMKYGEALSESETYFDECDFPYRLPPDAGHWQLWHRPGLSREEKASSLSVHAALLGVSGKDVIVFTNPIFNKSVPEFPHDQVLLKRAGALLKRDIKTLSRVASRLIDFIL